MNNEENLRCPCNGKIVLSYEEDRKYLFTCKGKCQCKTEVKLGSRWDAIDWWRNR